MGVPLLLQFSIALFTGMVAATFVPPIRRSIPWPAEVALWLALITACVFGVVSITDHNARDLTLTVAWGAEQVANTIFGLLRTGIGGSIYDHRFTIAAGLSVVAGGDVLALVIIRAVRRAKPWTPRVHLGEWMEIPPPAALVPVPERQPASRSRMDVGAAIAVITTAVLGVSAWLPRALRSHASRAERIDARARLDSLRDSAAHVRFAAGAWFEGAGRPAVNTAASWTSRTARRGIGPAAARAGHVIDISALMSAQSLGWYGPLGLRPVDTRLRGENEIDDDEQDAQRPDSLAS